jgi:hypothetical protein
MPAMRSEYDFSGGQRAKYAARYAKGTNLVLLDPDVARAFPDPAVINRILRAVAEAAPLRARRRVATPSKKPTKPRRAGA